MQSRRSVTGIEGRLRHDDYFLLMARFAALRGTCARRTVGCVLVDARHHVLSTGYNGVPSGEPHCTDHPCEGACDESGDTSRCKAIHAERNAVDQLKDRGLAKVLELPLMSKVRKAYVSVFPCFDCARYLWEQCRNLKEVHALRAYPDVRGVEYLTHKGILVKEHEHLTAVSLDKLLVIGERWR